MRRLFPVKLVIDPETWQKDLLALILRVSVVLGSLVYVPSVIVAARDGFLALVVIDTVALATIISLHQSARMPYRRRATVFCGVCYLLAVGLLISVGPISQVYLFGFSILATVLLGLRAGVVSSLLSAATLLVLGTLGMAAPEMAIPHWGGGVFGWVVITLNFALINTLLTVAIGAVLSALDVALAREVATRVSLEGERKLLRTLIDALPDIVFTKDAGGRVVTCNAAALAHAGLAHEGELAGKPAADLFPGGPADDAAVLAGHSLWNREEQAVGPAGSLAWHLTTKVPLRGADGEVVGLVGVSRDITARKLAEAERDRLLAQVQLQIERMPLAYLLSDADFRYVRWNPAAERMFGFTEAEVLGKHPFDVVVPPPSHALVAGIFDKIKAGAMEAHGESENRTKGGGTIVCEWHNTPMFDEAGAFAGLLSLAQNVTGRKELESQLRQSQKMDAVGRLAGGIAHDFNNLLTVITGYCELLLAAPEVGAEIREPVRAISDAGERAAALTRQLLGFSRQSLLQPKVLDVNAVVAETGKLLRRLIGEDILLTTALAPKLSRVKVDPSQLDQALINLAVNARDAMPTGGRLTIETADVELDASYAATHLDCKAGRHVMLAMTDTGCGMTPAVMARIFEPFYTTKEVGKGTGLGLSQVFGIVQQSGGCVHVYSEPGHGTTFKIYLPAVAEAAPAPSPAASRLAASGTETVLLVEDEAGVRGLARTSLQMHGYTVLTAVDGQDALRVAEAHRGPLDLVLTDVVMPNLSGPALAAALAARFPRLKVLFMSGYTDDAVVRHGLIEAEVAFIQKPYTPMALVQKVRQVLDEPPRAGARP